MRDSCEFFSRWNRKLTLVEVTVIVVILTVLYELLTAKPIWVSDGTIRSPVRVFVFDATNRRPIANAECAVLHAPPIRDASSLTKDHPVFDNVSMKEWPQSCRGTTDETGSASIEHTFGSSASNNHPNTRAHLMNEWIRVEADGFGGVAIPVGYDERPTSEIRKDGEIVVSIGLLPKHMTDE